MPIKTCADELVPLREFPCRRFGCHKVFYLCSSCYRGHRYCSTECSALARRRQRSAASLLYQQTPDGRRSHCEWQNAYRQRCRQRALTSSILVIDPSSMPSASGPSCGSDDASRPLPTLPNRPPKACRPPSQPVPLPGLHCLVCQRPGYLHKSDSMSFTSPENTPDFYVQAVLSLYQGLPDASQRISPLDEACAHRFFQRGIPFGVIETALLLGSLRRSARSLEAPPLPPIRSLAYFQPIIEELLRAPVSDAFRASLRLKMQRLRGSSDAANP